MKKFNYLLPVMCFCILSSFSMNAQFSVTNGDTIHAETTLIIAGPDSTVNVEQTNIKNLNGNTSSNWSPGSDHLVNFCDEVGYNGDYVSAVVAYIDKNGYYYQVSDATCKENIATINASLSRIVKLRGVEYNHKTVSDANNEKSNKATDPQALRCGFLAQEVETIIPEAVATGSTGKKYINYQAIIPFLVEALKEQQTQLAKQNEQIQLLQTQMNAILKSSKLK